jgi:hypothetical protein
MKLRPLPLLPPPPNQNIPHITLFSNTLNLFPSRVEDFNLLSCTISKNTLIWIVYGLERGGGREEEEKKIPEFSPNDSRAVKYLHCVSPVYRWWWLWRNWWNKDWQGKPKYSEKICHSATLSTTNPTRLYPGLNLGRRGGKPATNRLSHGVAQQNTIPKLRRFLQIWKPHA